MPTFQPYVPWLITIGRSAFLGSRAVHMVSASMSKVSRTGKPFGEIGMRHLQSARRRSQGHRARARPRALEVPGQGQHAAIGLPRADDLKADGQTVRREAARQRDRGVAGEIEWP